MRGETQANRLEMMMHKHHIHPSYTLSLPPFEVKKSLLKSLKEGDILLLGLDQLVFVLSDTMGIRAEVMIEQYHSVDRLKIISLGKDTRQKASKKYQRVLVTCGEVQSRKLEVGHVIGTMDLNFDELAIVVGEKKIAEGSLVKVDEKIALQVERLF
ncbi:MAG: FliM/FliN family flagellar motor switch protein [Sulfurimonas sp.]